MATRSANRACVIGGGIAGLVTAKVLRDDGFDVTLFERNATPGGVWAASRTYPGLRANNSYDSYAFSDFPYPPGTDDFPTAEQIRAHLGAYTEHFGLDPLLRLSTEVVSVTRAARAGRTDAAFDISVRPTGSSGASGSFGSEFVAVCNGVFCEPYLPRSPGERRSPVRSSTRVNSPIPHSLGAAGSS